MQVTTLPCPYNNFLIVKFIMKYRLFGTLFVGLFAGVSHGYNLNVPVANVAKVTKEELRGQNVLTIPYGFYNQNTGLAAAGVVAANGLFQPQTSAIVNAFVGSNGTTNLFAYVSDVQLPFMPRVFMDVQIMHADWGEIDSFQGGNPEFIGQQAGLNSSDKDNFISAEGTDQHLRLKFKYVLPIGAAKDNPIHTFAVSNGMLVKGNEAGGSNWNPLNSGRSIFTVEPFYRSQDFEDRDSSREFESTTSGVKLSLEYDNTDWYKNPSFGSKHRLSVTRDWGLNDDSSTWTAVQYQWNKYIPLPKTANTRQRTLALSVWTSDVPTWFSSHQQDGREIFHRAPVFDGSTLGGLDRQRGFSTNRFNNRSAINYAVEYRHSPVKNPFTTLPVVNKLGIRWWEWVGFLEVGRVADNWSLSDLHTDMKTSLGAGLRVNVHGLVIRADAAFSEDGGQVQMFFGHTF